MTTFNPDAAAAPGSGVFGLPHTREQARIILIPVPFDATTSYRPGTAAGPEAVRAASAQVDLYDRRFGHVYQKGIYMEDEERQIRTLSVRAAAQARPVIEAGGADADDPAVAKVNAACQELNQFVQARAAAAIEAGKIPAIIGGEHSVPFGAIKACARHHGSIGILHVDAHMDLRHAFEGFEWSHASIMHNVLTHVPAVSKLVQVGLRDFGESELNFAKSQGQRVVQFFDDQWAEQLLSGTSFARLAKSAVEALPERVYVSFDIDGLDPSLCPHTGTPVPGGLSFNQAALLLDVLRQSAKQIVGFDLVEVAPGPIGAPEWDANVGARILYKLCGLVT